MGSLKAYTLRLTKFITSRRLGLWLRLSEQKGKPRARCPPSAPDHGEIGRILEENGCRFTVTPGDGEALIERILALAGDRDLCAALGTRARMALERQWDKEQALAKWEAMRMASARIRIAACEASSWPSDGVRLSIRSKPDDRSSHF